MLGFSFSLAKQGAKALQDLTESQGVKEESAQCQRAARPITDSLTILWLFAVHLLLSQFLCFFPPAASPVLKYTEW